jgi:DNA-3-methyladenine glycosylase II
MKENTIDNSDFIKLDYTGDYSLEQSVNIAVKASFVEGFRSNNKILDLAVLIEGSWKSIAVSISQHGKDLIARVHDNPAKATTVEIKSQLERMLCLNVDGNYYKEIVSEDAVVAKLYQLQKGVRPILFPSAYEAAARAIIGHQLPVKQAAKIKERISEGHGVQLQIGNRKLFAFPSPQHLENLPYITGLADRKVEQLIVLGEKTGNWLNSAVLLKMSTADAFAKLQELPGIGPFSAELIMLRGAGDMDAFPEKEMRLQKAMAIAYHLDENPDMKKLLKIADNWRPYRSWVGLLMRNSIS